MKSKWILAALPSLLLGCGGGERQPSEGELEAFVNRLEADERSRNAAEIAATRREEERREVQSEKRLKRSESKRRE